MSQIAPVGYAGQKYAVYGLVVENNKVIRRPWGWTNEVDGGTLANAVMVHPDTLGCVVIEVATNLTVTRIGVPIAEDTP